MRHPDNSYEFDRLNAQFDRKFDNLKRKYDIKAQSIFRADSAGTSIRRRNPLWAWFDRKTKFRIFPKILLAMTALTLAAAICYIGTDFAFNLFGHDERIVMFLALGLVAEVLCCIAVFSPGEKNDEEFPMCLDIVTNPAFKDLECNVYHEEPHERR